MRRAHVLLGTSFALFEGCAGEQSVLDPASPQAARIAELFWFMTAGSSVIWLAVMAAALAALLRPPGARALAIGRSLIVGGGVIAPTLLLAALLSYGLAMLPPLLAAAPAGSLRVEVTGEQYWWRVRYLRHPGGGAPAVELANEVRLPRGRHVELELVSKDVIHSFWVPALGGKVDMIPGRRNRLVLQPTRAGEFQGVCAEFCGSSHALMQFRALVVEPAEFEAWLGAQARAAVAAEGALVARGRGLFEQSGCGACHTVRGTSARGTLGPDLTHVGGRRTIGAGALPNDAVSFERWLRETDRAKPGVAMPHFRMLPVEQQRALAAYLESLQ